MTARFFRHLAAFALLAAGFTAAAAPPRSAALPARRIVSLSPALTETVCRLGAESALVGRSSACDVPERIRRLPVAGSLGQPAVEVVLSLSPDAVVCDIDHPRSEWELLRRRGIDIRRYPAKRLADYPQTVLDLGRLLGKSAEAETEIARFQRELDTLRDTMPRRKTRVLLLLGVNPPVTCGRGTFLDELVTLAGGENVAAGASSRDYFTLSPEFIVRMRPEAILALGMTGAAKLISELPGWQELPAVRDRRVVTDLDANLLYRLGPRTPEGVKLLRKRLFDLKSSPGTGGAATAPPAH